MNAFKFYNCIFCTFLANTLQIKISRFFNILLYSLSANTVVRSQHVNTGGNMKYGISNIYLKTYQKQI